LYEEGGLSDAPNTPAVEHLKASEVRQNWREVLERVYNHEAEVIVEKSGIPVAAVVSIQDYRRLERERTRWKEAFALIDTVRAAFADVPEDELLLEIDRAIAEARADNRASLIAEVSAG
jgi:prevent-host-death family protein